KSYMNYGDSRNGDYKFWNKDQLNLDTDFLAAYTKELSKTVGLSVNAGASSFYRSLTESYSSSDGLIVPYVYSLNNTQGPVQATNYLEDKEIRSVYGSAGLDLWQAVFLNVTARNDWSSTLPKLNNSYFYPSASVSAIVSEFIKMPKAIDFIKVYGSWSEVSSDLDPYSIYSAYNKGVTYGSTPSVNYSSSLVNPDIMP